jgi:hypothetical protein
MTFTTNNYIGPSLDQKVNELTAQEIEQLLLLIKNSVFKGEQVEVIYNLVFKLQQQYIDKTK